MSTLICYTGKYPHLGGVSTHLDILLHEAKKHSEIKILFSNRSRNTNSGGNSNHSIWLLLASYMYRILVFGVKYFGYPGKFNKYVCHDYFSAFFLLMVGKRNVTIVIHGELANELVAISSIKKDSFFYNFFVRFEKVVYKKAALIICVDSRIQKYISGLNINDRNISVKNFISRDYLNKILENISQKLPPLPFQYIYCSRRLVPKNGVIVLLKAYKIYLESTPDPNIKLVIGGSGNELHSLKQFDEDNNLGVVFLGDIEYHANMFYTANAGFNVVPSIAIGDYVEATAYSMLESMALKVPVLVSNIGGLGEVIINGENGFSFPQGDFKMAASCIKTIINSPADQLTKIVEAGFKTILNEHAAENILDKYYLK